MLRCVRDSYLLNICKPESSLVASKVSPISPIFPNPSVKVSPRSVFNSSINKDSDVMIWHYRLGHPSFQYLERLFPSLFINTSPNIFNCEICQLAKHTRASYPNIAYTPSEPFSLVHSDIWGPSRIKNINGARWFVSFVDDHTRLTWVFLMREKSDVVRIF